MNGKRRIGIAAAVLLAAVLLLSGCGRTKAPMPEEAAAPSFLPQTQGEPRDRAEQILADMSPEQKIGQLMFVRYPGGGASAMMKEYQFGGYVLYARDFKDGEEWLSPAALDGKLGGICEMAEIPPFFAVDEEGGTVTRASQNPNFFPDGAAAAPQRVWKIGGKAALKEDALAKNTRLRELGLNVNLAPVADVSTDTGAFMYARSMGTDAATTAELVALMVEAQKESGMGSVVKHFPGYGNSEDSHWGTVMDRRPREQFEQEDFLPFSAAFAAGADAVMMSHNTVTCMDDKLPASLSAEVHRVLREELGFEGVIITDDLIMSAVAGYDRKGGAAVLAILAGNDMIVTTGFEQEYDQLLKALKTGELTEERLNESVLRILRWKLRLGLLE